LEAEKRIFKTIFIAMTSLLMLVVLRAAGQPQGYTLVYSPSRAYGVDWMEIKAVYVKTEGNRLYFYIEYYGAIPSSGDYTRNIHIYMDTDRNNQTGMPRNKLGVDSWFYFNLLGDNSSAYAWLYYRWNSTTRSWFGKNLMPNMKRAPGLDHMEIWVDQQDIGYTPGGMNLRMEAWSYVEAIPKTELNYVVGSSAKQITVDGDPGDWGTMPPLISFTPRSVNPPEMEASGIYIADDAENLYIRLDTRGTPTASLSTGSLARLLAVYFDIDNNDATGCFLYGGAEFRIMAYFYAEPKSNPYLICHRYIGTGRDEKWENVSIEGAIGLNSVLEFKAPLSSLGLSSGQTVGIYVPKTSWNLYLSTPVLTFLPDTTPPAISGASPTGSLNVLYAPASVTFSVRVEDSGSGVKEVRLIVDGVSQGTMSRDGDTYTKTVSLSEGPHTWSVEAVDNAGNAATQSNTLTVSSLLIWFLTIVVVVIIAILLAVLLLRRRRLPPPPPPPPPA